MSLDNVNREPSPCRKGEGCQAPLSNSQAAAQNIPRVFVLTDIPWLEEHVMRNHEAAAR